MGALDGVRVLNFTWGAVGGGMSQGWSRLGAEVVKVESHRRPDFVREIRATNPIGGLDDSPYNNDYHVNQLSVTIDMRKPEGIALVKELVKVSDIVAQNMLPGVFDRLGLGYDVLKQLKPDIIMVSASAPGQKGPESGAPGYAPLFAAAGGLSWMVGYQDGPPAEIRAVTDMLGGMTSYAAAIAALIRRNKTGEGAFIDVSVSEVVTGLIGDAVMDYFMNGNIQSRRGNLDDIGAPHNCYRCQGEDSWISIAVFTQQEWEILCHEIGKPELMSDPRFADALTRCRNQAELDPIIEQWTQNYTSYEVMDRLQKVGVAAVPSMDAEQIYSDPHLEARGVFDVITHQKHGARIFMNWPWQYSATPTEIVSDASLFGQDTKHVLSNLLHKTDAEIELLEQAGVLY